LPRRIKLSDDFSDCWRGFHEGVPIFARAAGDVVVEKRGSTDHVITLEARLDGELHHAVTVLDVGFALMVGHVRLLRLVGAPDGNILRHVIFYVNR
jgi:hypothetical protein